jgi:hypothetical protein
MIGLEQKQVATEHRIEKATLPNRPTTEKPITDLYQSRSRIVREYKAAATEEGKG